MFHTGSIPKGGSSRITPPIKNYDTFYLLKNRRNKCMSWGLLHSHGPYESDCDSEDKNQHWKWYGDKRKHICNHLYQCLSSLLTNLRQDKDKKLVKKFDIKLLRLRQFSNANQEWKATDSGQLVEINIGLCLGVAYKSLDEHHLLLTADSCDQKDDGQFWSFESILIPHSISTATPPVMGINIPEKPSSIYNSSITFLHYKQFYFI